VYFGSCNGVFRRLDVRTGRIHWETNVRDGRAKQYFFHGDVFIAADRIVASSDVDTTTGAEAGVHAFDLGTGRQLWKYSAGRGVPGAVVGSGSRVFAYTATGDLIALNLASGKPEWTHAVKAGPWENPAILDHRVFAGSNDGSVYAFESQTGRVQWHHKLAAPITTSIAATASEIYAGTADRKIYRLAPSNGDVRASVDVDSVLTPTSAPVGGKDAVLVLLADKEANYRAIVSLDPTLARVRWRHTAPDRWTTSRVFATPRTVIVGSPSGEVTAYCAADGSVGWSHQLAKAPIRSIGGTDETLLVGTPAGTLYAIRPPPACMRSARLWIAKNPGSASTRRRPPTR
jgi:outer membrane protein assembly factor BamB